MHMQPLRARVEGGRLKLDEPTDLPDGTEVTLTVADEWDALGDGDRAALHREISAGLADRKAGAPTVAADEVLAELAGR